MPYVPPGTVQQDHIPRNAWERREFCLVEEAQTEAQVWVVAKELEARGQAAFPRGWMAEIRVFQGSRQDPRGYTVKCICNFRLSSTPFEMLILSPATSRSSLGCWIPRAFRVVGS